MYLLIPVDKKELSDAKITKINDASIWLQLYIEDGKIAQSDFNEDWSAFDNLSQAVIVKDDGEYVWPFMEYNMMVLVAHTQESIDDIVEAFLFKELHELAY